MANSDIKIAEGLIQLYEEGKGMPKLEISVTKKRFEPYPKLLCQRASELGASEAVVVPVTTILCLSPSSGKFL